MQMTLPTAQAITTTHRRHAFGPPTRQKLQEPVIGLYYAAAALEGLATFEGQHRSLAFQIQAYVSGVCLCHKTLHVVGTATYKHIIVTSSTCV